jgi:hypothetical protein
LKQARLWRDQGFDDFTIAVNVSTLQLLRPNFFAEVMSLLQAAGVPAHMLTLEINESALTNNVNFVHETLANLRNEGISLSLDNFGTGDSSLSALVRYPVDKLKIDRSFIKAPAGNRRSSHCPRDHCHGPPAGHDRDCQRRGIAGPTGLPAPQRLRCVPGLPVRRADVGRCRRHDPAPPLPAPGSLRRNAPGPHAAAAG